MRVYLTFSQPLRRPSLRTIAVMTLLLLAGYCFSQTAPPAPQPAPPPSALNQAQPADPSLPALSHDEKVKFFDTEDQIAAIVAKYQKQWDDATAPIRKAAQEAVAPIQKQEDDLIRQFEQEHPGYTVVHGPQGLQVVKKPADDKKPAAPAGKK